jgi:Na+-translocating ferredoxin:NAD+ oxidoreductase subunit B
MIAADDIDALLPQTQCTKCGFAGCRPYAEALARGEADIDQCPPGGAAGIARLAALLARAPKPLNPGNGVEGQRSAALIDEAHCIGCTLCIQACPTDAIVGAPKLMHTVVIAQCTGCELCVPPCPVDCIEILPLAELSRRGSKDAEREALVPLGEHSDRWRQRYQRRQRRRAREQAEHDRRLAAKAARGPGPGEARGADPAAERKRAAIQAAMQRARARRSAGSGPTGS